MDTFLIIILLTISITLGFFFYKARLQLKKIGEIDEYKKDRENEILIQKQSVEKELINKQTNLDNYINTENKKLQLNQNNINNEISIKTEELKLLKKDIIYSQGLIATYIDNVNNIESGIYNLEFRFEDSIEYKEKITKHKEHLKWFIKEKMAVISKTELKVNGNAKEGQKILNKTIKLMLKAFNGDCDTIISKVHKNSKIETLITKIQKSAEVINKLNESLDLEINEKYINVKIKELKLTYELILKKEEEKEIEKQKREEEREIEKAQKELDKEKERLEDLEAENKRKLIELQEELSHNAQNKKLRLKIEALEQTISENNIQKTRVMSQAQLTSSGYVYIISNIGSFGVKTYKIGMTRRLDPMDRIRELGNASVPFHFDTHALIYSDNAPKLEKEFHKFLNKRRVNKVNNRKEFFNMEKKELQIIINKLIPNNNVNLVLEQEAREYRLSIK